VDSGGCARAVDANQDPEQLLASAIDAVTRATFTGKGDKPKVVARLERFAWIVRTAGERAQQVTDADGGLELSVDPRIVREWTRGRWGRGGAGSIELLAETGRAQGGDDGETDKPAAAAEH
jgi:hypothetical protein